MRILSFRKQIIKMRTARCPPTKNKEQKKGKAPHRFFGAVALRTGICNMLDTQQMIQVKRSKRKIRKGIKALSKLSAAVSLAFLAAVAFVGSTLPDSFTTRASAPLSIASAPYITVRRNESVCALSSGTVTNTLMLFGTVPIKQVSSEAVQTPLVILGGNPFGIKLEAGGAVAVGFYQVENSCPAKDCGMKQGDVILSANGTEIYDNQQFANEIMKSGGDPMEIKVLRGEEEKLLTLTPKACGGTYKAGVNIRDSSAGVGTMTFYDADRKMFAGLGHAVCDSDTGKAFPCGEGCVCDVDITGVRKSSDGSPGELQGLFSGSKSSGDILLNCSNGVFGTAEKLPEQAQLCELGFRQEITKGKAEILCSVDGKAPKRYSIVIESIDLTGGNGKDMVIRVTDKELLTETGGIVQGMSGSPIVQNGRLVGAVTHVFVKDTCRGYAIFADRMYETMLSCCSDRLQLAG